MEKITKGFKFFFLLVAVVAAIALLGLRVLSAVQNLKPFIDTIMPIINNPFASYDEKMSLRYPVYYDFIMKVRSIVPENSTVYIPDIGIPYGQKFWPVSDINITSSLLFPRQVLFFDGKYTPDNKNPIFIIVAEKSPDVFVKAKKIYIFKQESILELPGDYIPENYNLDTEGLIQI